MEKQIYLLLTNDGYYIDRFDLTKESKLKTEFRLHATEDISKAYIFTQECYEEFNDTLGSVIGDNKLHWTSFHISNSNNKLAAETLNQIMEDLHDLKVSVKPQAHLLFDMIEHQLVGAKVLIASSVDEKVKEKNINVH